MEFKASGLDDNALAGLTASPHLEDSMRTHRGEQPTVGVRKRIGEEITVKLQSSEMSSLPGAVKKDNLGSVKNTVKGLESSAAGVPPAASLL